MKTRPLLEFADATNSSIHALLMEINFVPENLKYKGIDGSSQIDDRPLPTLRLSCHEKKNFSPRRSFELMTM